MRINANHFACDFRAFITQFTRSMHVESWGSGVDFLAVTPFYVVSNLYKRKSGTLIAPMPIKLVEGTFAQLGKKMIWQVSGVPPFLYALLS